MALFQSLFMLFNLSTSVIERYQTDLGSHTLVCKKRAVEIGLVLDSSISLTPGDFEKAKRFLQDFVKQFDVNSGERGVRVAMITFDKGIHVETSFNLDTFRTKEEVLEAISAIPQNKGTYTDTGSAIKYMHVVQLSPYAVRQNADKLGLVITDGNSHKLFETLQAALAARADGIKIVAVGIGFNVDLFELVNIAGECSMVFQLDNFDNLGSSSFLKNLTKKTCFKRRKLAFPLPASDSN